MSYMPLPFQTFKPYFELNHIEALKRACRRTARLTKSNQGMEASGPSPGMRHFAGKEAEKMERQREDLLNEYRDANLTRRLHIYLEHRGLRAEFMEMDQKELRSDAVRRRAKSGWLSRFFACHFERAGWHCAGTRGCAGRGNPPV